MCLVIACRLCGDKCCENNKVFNDCMIVVHGCAAASVHAATKIRQKLGEVNFRKLVVVTMIVGEKVRLIVELLSDLMVSARSLVSTEVVVQGSGQSDSWVPSGRSS